MNEQVKMICEDLARRNKLVDSDLNGIDYIEVPKDDQQNIRLYFIKPEEIPNLTRDQVRIEGGIRVKNIYVDREPKIINTGSSSYLEVHVNQAGDFSTYILVIDRPGEVDTAFSKHPFSFKAGCPSHFNCYKEIVCPPALKKEPLIDYMAKDYASFRQALIDFIPSVIPNWKEQHESDLGVAFVDLFSYIGDQLSYYQDAVANEAYLETARQRESVKHHARLVDYKMHDGSNARTFIHVQIKEKEEDEDEKEEGKIPARTAVISRTGLIPQVDTETSNKAGNSDSVRTQMLSEAEVVFETVEEVAVYCEHNKIKIHTWGNSLCCVPIGTTSLYLKGDLFLKKDDFLLFEEVKGPESGIPADANPHHRQVVRIKDVKKTEDPLEIDQPTGKPLSITQVSWQNIDALKFPLCVSSKLEDGAIKEDVSVARGNIILADHGETIEEYHPANPFECPKASGIKLENRSYRFELKEGPITFHAQIEENNKAKPSAQQMLEGDPQKSIADVRLECIVDPHTTSEEEQSRWKAVPHLLDSNPFDRHFVVETRNDGRAVIRFGDGSFGMRPPEGSYIKVIYRIGNGVVGNAGAETLVDIVEPPSSETLAEMAEPVSSEENESWPDIPKVRNPLPASGGIEPETIDQVRHLAPKAFHAEQFRAVTRDDYSRKTEEHPEVAKAVATFRWTGSWHTVFIRVDPKGRMGLTPDLEERVKSHISRYKLAGYDIEIDAPVYVPLEIEINICVARDHFRMDVEEVTLEALSNKEFPDGRKGFFNPDNFTFSQPVYLSSLYEVLGQVAGIDSAEVIMFKRLGGVESGELNQGFIPMGRSEIACLDNDPNFPENGVLRLNMMGGK